jgi:RHS repeat-associated protein
MMRDESIYDCTPHFVHCACEFTSKERDAETGLDYFGARYFSSAQGRFTSPDSINVTNDRLLNPSSTLNKYAYGGNNPLKYTDPDGKDITIFYETGDPTGHVMMAAVNQQTNDFAFLSVGPQSQYHEAAGMPWNWNSGVPGTSEFNLPQSADDLRQNFAALTIQTTPEVAQQAIEAIRNGAGTGNWSVLGNNCTTACVKVLKDIGLSPGSKGLLPWTPSKLWANLYLKYGKSKPPAFVRGALAATSLIQRPVSAGTDYGNPRYGTNTFDFVMQQINAPTKACVTTQGPNGPETACQ